VFDLTILILDFGVSIIIILLLLMCRWLLCVSYFLIVLSFICFL